MSISTGDSTIPFTIPFGATVPFTTEVFTDPIGGLVFMTPTTTLVTDTVTPITLPDMVIGTITTTDTAGVMHVPPTPGAPVAMLTPVLQEGGVPAKAITVQTAHGIGVTAEHLPKAIRRAPADTM